MLVPGYVFLKPGKSRLVQSCWGWLVTLGPMMGRGPKCPESAGEHRACTKALSLPLLGVAASSCVARWGRGMPGRGRRGGDAQKGMGRGMHGTAAGKPCAVHRRLLGADCCFFFFLFFRQKLLKD